MSNIKPPPAPEPAQISYVTDSVMRSLEVRSFTERQLLERDAQWLEMVGPVVDALERIAGYSLSQFKNAPDMAAQCVDDAAKALAAITKD